MKAYYSLRDGDRHQSFAYKASKGRTCFQRLSLPMMLVVVVALFFSSAIIGASMGSVGAVDAASTGSNDLGISLSVNEPLLNVPFVVTASSTSSALARGNDLYLTRGSSCDITTAVGSVCQLDANLQCVFTVTEATLSASGSTNPSLLSQELDETNSTVTQLYLCSSAVSSGSMPTFLLRRVTVSPLFVPIGVSTALHFSATTPFNTVIGFFIDAECQRESSVLAKTTLTDSRTYTVTIDSSQSVGSLFVCTQVPYSSASGEVVQTSFYNVGRFLVSTISTYSPHTALRYASTTFTLDSASSYVQFMLSTSTQCETVDQVPVAAAVSYRVAMTVLVPKGSSYTLCAGISDGKRIVYAPTVGVLEVREYGLQPHSMYVGRATAMTATLDAATSGTSGALQFAVFGNGDCATNAIRSWSTDLTAWTISTAGTYYACARVASTQSSVSRAAQLTVYNTPTVSFNRDPAVKGISLIATVQRPTSVSGSLQILLSGSQTCASPLVTAAVVAGTTTTTFTVPYTAPNSVYVCLSTPSQSTSSTTSGSSDGDGAYVYSIGTLTTRFYNLSYPVIFAGDTVALTMDDSVAFSAGSQWKITLASANVIASSGSINSPCSGNAYDGVVRTLGDGYTTKLADIHFTDSGIYSFCVKNGTSSSAGFQRLRDLTVNSLPTASPANVLPGVTTTVSLSPIQSGMTVYATTSPTQCSSSEAVGGTSTQAGASGSASVTIRLAAASTVNFCAGYADSNGRVTYFNVASIGTCTVRHFPQYHVIQQQGSFYFDGCPAMATGGMSAFLVSGSSSATTCPSQVPASVTPAVVSVSTTSTTSIAAASISAGSTGAYVLCVGNVATGEFVSAGGTSVIGTMSVTPGTSAVVNYLPSTANVSTSTSLNAFILTTNSTSCAALPLVPTLYDSGTVTMSTSTIGTTSVFVAPAAGTAALCVSGSGNAWRSTDGSVVAYIFAASVTVVPFKATITRVQSGAPNVLYASPQLEKTALYLVGASCASAGDASTCQTGDAELCENTAEDKRYYTSLSQPLAASEGLYLLCQQAVDTWAYTGAVAASTNVLEVVTKYDASLPSSVRRYVPFTMTVTGGDMSSRSSGVTFFTLPGTMDCNAQMSGSIATMSESFTSTAANPGVVQITLTTMSANQDVRICMRVSDSVSFSMAAIPLRPYMSPAAMLLDQDVSISSGLWTSDTVTKISSTSTCADQLSEALGSVTGGSSTLYVQSCSPTTASVTQAYYCESRDGGTTYASRGVMQLLRLRSCATNERVGIVSATAAPGTAVSNYGLDTSLFVNPRPSLTADCSSTSIVPFSTTYGYNPMYDENAKFYVCASPIADISITITADGPTLTVLNYVPSRKSIPSRVNRTYGVAMPFTITFNYKTPTMQTYISTHSSCSDTVASLAGLGSSSAKATMTLTGASGLVYVCTSKSTTAVAAVAQLLVVMPPDVLSLNPAVVPTASYRISLRARGNTYYSMIPGADTGSTYSPFYDWTTRSVFLSTDACISVAAGSASTTVVSGSNQATITTTSSLSISVGTVSVCAGTPAGNLTVVAGIPVSNDKIFPSQFVLGATTNVYIPLSPSSQFVISASDGDCGAVGSISGFSTDSTGVGSLTFLTSSGLLPTAGTYTICKSGTSTSQLRADEALPALRSPPLADTVLASKTDYTVLTKVTTYNPVYYGVTGRDVFVGVFVQLALENDLTIDRLLPGFSTVAYCDDPTTESGSWTSVSTQVIEVDATAAASQLYLCAVAPINGSRIALPVSTGLTFVSSSSITFPSTVSACQNVEMQTCSAGSVAKSSTAYVAVVDGGCCSANAASQIVAKSSPSGASGCHWSVPASALIGTLDSMSFSVCLFDSKDKGYCAALGSVSVNNSICSDAAISGSSKGLHGGALVAVIVLSVVIGLLIIGIIAVAVFCCCRNQQTRKKANIGELQENEADEEEATAVMNAIAAFRRRELEQQRLSRDQRDTGSACDTIDIDTTEERELMQYRLLSNVAEDDRDQIELCEARDRHTMRQNFLEGIEVIRVIEKNRDLDEDGSAMDNDDASFLNALGEAHALPELADGDANYLTALGCKNTIDTSALSDENDSESGAHAKFSADVEVRRGDDYDDEEEALNSSGEIVSDVPPHDSDSEAFSDDDHHEDVDEEEEVEGRSDALIATPDCTPIQEVSDYSMQRSSGAAYDPCEFLIANEKAHRRRIETNEADEREHVSEAEFNSYVDKTRNSMNVAPQPQARHMEHPSRGRQLPPLAPHPHHATRNSVLHQTSVASDVAQLKKHNSTGSVHSRENKEGNVQNLMNFWAGEDRHGKKVKRKRESTRGNKQHATGSTGSIVDNRSASGSMPSEKRFPEALSEPMQLPLSLSAGQLSGRGASNEPGVATAPMPYDASGISDENPPVGRVKSLRDRHTTQGPRTPREKTAKEKELPNPRFSKINNLLADVPLVHSNSSRDTLSCDNSSTGSQQGPLIATTPRNRGKLLPSDVNPPLSTPLPLPSPGTPSREVSYASQSPSPAAIRQASFQRSHCDPLDSSSAPQSPSNNLNVHEIRRSASSPDGIAADSPSPRHPDSSMDSNTDNDSRRYELHGTDNQNRIHDSSSGYTYVTATTSTVNDTPVDFRSAGNTPAFKRHPPHTQSGDFVSPQERSSNSITPSNEAERSVAVRGYSTSPSSASTPAVSSIPMNYNAVENKSRSELV